MISSIDLFAAILNMEQHFYTRSVIRSHHNVPYNNVRLGPHQVLHLEDGSRNEDIVWYGSNYVEEQFLTSISSRKKLPKFLDKWLGLLRGHPFEDALKGAIKQYHSALGQTDYHVTVLMLWSSLEIITDTTKSESKITIRRASALSKRPDVTKLKLEHVSNVRNRYAHIGSHDDMISDVLEFLRGWVEAMLRYAAYSGRSHKNIYDFCAVLDKASSSKTELEKDVFISKRALKLIES